MSSYLHIVTFCIITALCAQIPCFAVVLHPDGEPNLIEWTDRPEPNVVGRWSTGEAGASCVAVATNAIITIRHQGGGIGTSVWFGGIEYIVEEVINEPAPQIADLRICRVKRKTPGATWLKYTPLYTLTNERNKEFVIGGYGKGRGTPVSDANGDGFSWTGNNQTQRWGTNKILNLNWNELAEVKNNEGVVVYASDTIKSKFDQSGATAYEAAVAEHDSGGGWFIKDSSSGKWFLFALNGYVNYLQASYYSPPEYQWGIRISSYADWISQNIPSRLNGDYSGDNEIDSVDFSILAANWERLDCLANNGCNGVDFEPDGDVDLVDLAAFLDNWP